MDDKSFIQAMAKHLPPSGAALRLLDIGGRAGATLAEWRSDLDITAFDVKDQDWGFSPDSADSIVAYNYPFEGDFFKQALTTLRPGGRFIGVDPVGHADQKWVMRLEQAGFTRILVEAETGGVLIRGEKPHTEEHTVDRIKQVADRDSAASFQGRYVHLLIRQTPNKPVWALKPDEKIEWKAAALAGENEPVLLAFSSLPKAVAFMQPAVMNGLIKDINKVAKFSRETAQIWSLLANPTLEMLAGQSITLIPIDPDTAETPDE
jgi:SAM-dependent methyltransferase